MHPWGKRGKKMCPRDARKSSSPPLISPGINHSQKFGVKCKCKCVRLNFYSINFCKTTGKCCKGLRGLSLRRVEIPIFFVCFCSNLLARLLLARKNKQHSARRVAGKKDCFGAKKEESSCVHIQKAPSPSPAAAAESIFSGA